MEEEIPSLGAYWNGAAKQGILLQAYYPTCIKNIKMHRHHNCTQAPQNHYTHVQNIYKYIIFSTLYIYTHTQTYICTHTHIYNESKTNYG